MALREDVTVKMEVNGETKTFENISQLEVENADGGKVLFTHLHSLYSYLLEPATGENMWRVKANYNISAGGLSAGNACIVGVTDALINELGYENNGYKYFYVVLTPKQLSIDSIYHLSEM